MASQRFAGSAGVTIAADAVGDPAGRTVLFLPGGGQTRHSWRKAAGALGAMGYHAVTMDLRGHGESDWAADGDYSPDAHIADLRAVLAQLPADPIVVGASLGGLIATAAIGESAPPPARALVLVDIVPQVNPAGASEVIAFMRGRPDGFATVEEAADAVAAYHPGRPRPRDSSGLRRNLREVDGRFFWHWDPRIAGNLSLEVIESRVARTEAAARQLTLPVLVVRGRSSAIVGEEQIARFRALVPHADYADIAGSHMIAGDDNGAFLAAILPFLRRYE